MKGIKNRKETVRRERMVAGIGTVLVLAGLVSAGVYVNRQSVQEQGDGYEIDFAQLEDSAGEKYAELEGSVKPQGGLLSDDALDYMPREDILEEGIYMEEAGSGKVEIGKLKEDIEHLNEDVKKLDSPIIDRGEDVQENVSGLSDAELAEAKRIEAQILEQQRLESERLAQFEAQAGKLEAAGLYMPVTGDVLMHYDMDHTVYFATLDQYKYNPATIISAAVDSPVYACADATVKAVYANEEIGNAVCLDLGGGYEVTYGQIKDLQYSPGQVVLRGEQIASVAEPTKYYSAEGSNLYFAMRKDGASKNAEALLPLQ